MRRLGVPVSADFKVLAWREAVECAMRPMMVVKVLESIDMLGDLVDVGWQFDGCVELVAPCAVAALDGSVELWRSRRQHIEGDVVVTAGGLELGHELGAVWMALMGQGISDTTFFRKSAAFWAVA